MPINLTDEFIVREYPTSHLEVMGGGLVQRGFAELRPRRISHVKVATTLIRQMQISHPEVVDSSTLLMPLNGNEVRDIQRHLIDINNLRLAPPTLPDLLVNLTHPNDRQIIAVISDNDRPRHDAHSAFARVIHAQHPRLENQLAKSVADAMVRTKIQYDSLANERRKLVIEERPGKATVLDLSDMSWRSALKRLQLLANREPGSPSKSALEAPEGWGLAAMRISPASISSGTSNHRKIRVACLSIRMPGEDINLDTGDKLQKIVNLWLKSEFGVTTQELKRLVISDPWIVIAHFIAEAFKRSGSSSVAMYPDNVFGWQPLMTAMEFCLGRELPALAIFTGTYPDVHLMAVSA